MQPKCVQTRETALIPFSSLRTRTFLSSNIFSVPTGISSSLPILNTFDRSGSRAGKGNFAKPIAVNPQAARQLHMAEIPRKSLRLILRPGSMEEQVGHASLFFSLIRRLRILGLH